MIKIALKFQMFVFVISKPGSRALKPLLSVTFARIVDIPSKPKSWDNNAIVFAIIDHGFLMNYSDGTFNISYLSYSTR